MSTPASPLVPDSPEKDGLDLDALMQRVAFYGAAKEYLGELAADERTSDSRVRGQQDKANGILGDIEDRVTRLRSELAALRESRDDEDEKLRATRSVNPSGLPDDAIDDDVTAHHWRVLRPHGIHVETYRLVVRFANALAAKLREAENKYGYDDGWRSRSWMDKCRTKLREHVKKGDPRDVAAYCAFLWHHGEFTTAKPDGAAKPRSKSNNESRALNDGENDAEKVADGKSEWLKDPRSSDPEDVADYIVQQAWPAMQNIGGARSRGDKSVRHMNRFYATVGGGWGFGGTNPRSELFVVEPQDFGSPEAFRAALLASVTGDGEDGGG